MAQQKFPHLIHAAQRENAGLGAGAQRSPRILNIEQNNPVGIEYCRTSAEMVKYWKSQSRLLVQMNYD